MSFRTLNQLWVAAVLIFAFCSTSAAQILVEEPTKNATPPVSAKNLLPSTGPVEAEKTNWDWLEFQVHIQKLTRQQEQEGIAYMASGALTLLGSTIGLSQVENPIERSVYSLSQTLSIAAFGYGYYQYKIGSDDRNFYQLLAGTHTLTDEQKSDLITSYYKIRKDQMETQNTIRFYTYLTISALNFVQANNEKNKDLKTAMMFIGGVSALAAFTIAF